MALNKECSNDQPVVPHRSYLPSPLFLETLISISQMLSPHCNTPVAHDWFFDLQCRIELTPALGLNHERGCNLNYPHYHPMLASSDNAADGHSMSNLLSHDMYMTVSENIVRDNQQPDNLVRWRWRSMGWPKEIYPPSQGPPRSVDQVYTRDPGIIDQTPEMPQYTDMDHPIHISTSVHRLAPLYYPSAFFHTLGPHNVSLVILHLQHLEAMPPRAEAWDENEENDETDRGPNESRVPTPPWLEDPKPWLMSSVAAHGVPIEVEPLPTEETRARESLKVRIDLRRLQTHDIVPMELDRINSEDRRDSEALKIKIDLRRLLLLRKGRSLRGPLS